jgi:hypothetical protein
MLFLYCICMEHNLNPLIGQTVLDTQITIEADVWLWQSFKVVCHLFTLLLHSHFLWQRFSRFCARICCCVKRAVSMEKWNHRWCVWNEDHTQLYITQNWCVSWGAFSFWWLCTGLKQLGREADNSAVVRRLRMHEAFHPHLYMSS